jgi:hypothetical protein
MRRSLLPLAALLALAACTTPRASEPQPAAPVPVPTATAAPTPPAPPADRRDWPLTPGGWAYRQDARGSLALFGVAGGDAVLTLRCDRGRGRLYLSRRSDAAAAASLEVRTTSTTRTLAARPTGGTPAYLAAELAPGDALLDAMGYSRGRFTVSGGGGAALVVPAWPEVLRVTEDCRG